MFESPGDFTPESQPATIHGMKGALLAFKGGPLFITFYIRAVCKCEMTPAPSRLSRGNKTRLSASLFLPRLRTELNCFLFSLSRGFSDAGEKGKYGIVVAIQFRGENGVDCIIIA